MSFAATTNKHSTSRKKDKGMKMESKVISAIIAVTQSKWMRPALMTLASVAAVLVVTGCDGSHDSGHHGKHQNQTHFTSGNC
jgi:hypothetical protein